MADKRSQRKPKVVPFLDQVDRDIQRNLQDLIKLAKQLSPEGFESVIWDKSIWTVTGGKLIKLSGKNLSKADLVFHFSPKLGGEPIPSPWSDYIKALFLLRFHQKQQSTPNQRNFITTLGYVAYAMTKKGLDIARLTPEYLDLACRLLSEHYSESLAYNMHKAVNEFAAYCDANRLCKAYLNYKYHKMSRPDTTGGVGYKRLDDPEALEIQHEKMVDPKIYQILGELYQKVPKDHDYRFYILLLTLMACTGRRYSEISLLPLQQVNQDDEGRSFIEYFPRKTNRGSITLPKRQLFLPTKVVGIVASVIDELIESCARTREVAAEVRRCNGPDIRFLAHIKDDDKLYKEDLGNLGITTSLFGRQNRFFQEGWVLHDKKNCHSNGKTKPYTNKQNLIEFCYLDFRQEFVSPIVTDLQGKDYFLEDMLAIRHPKKKEKFHFWVASQCTHAMLTTFLRYFPDLAKEYASISASTDFTSHHFRHTLNTLLDEGGLTDLLQTRWFGRANRHDTKAYQHTSREKKALLFREAIKDGQAGGLLARQVVNLPIDLQDAVLEARVQAVHDVGPGFCIHNFVQTPCERHLQCTAECKDYVWIKDDPDRIEELKRQWAMACISRDTAEKQSKSKKPKKSIDWLTHSDKKLRTLAQQLADNDIEPFDPYEYLGISHYGQEVS
ncbi:integrase [Phormidium tenue]|uniref:Integrase n=1 Tax=Phormidium tenue NIES-30 TaxID=549789 RepID=A0A1U7J5H0_9CYAN|nr:integrase [Phormidium tenue]MBD2232516.1 integrase [Phormidium tenue FACHB-1052]OKH48006.1 integrase [Phormidium tenue NIES-30]